MIQCISLYFCRFGVYRYDIFSKKTTLHRTSPSRSIRVNLLHARARARAHRSINFLHDPIRMRRLDASCRAIG